MDIDPETFNLDPELVEQAITPRTKAIMPVHLYGYVCDMDALQAIADKHGLVIIEDACQAVGATYRDKVAGSFGTGCFSLYATKNVMSGEGGMITTNDDAIAEQVPHAAQSRHEAPLLSRYAGLQLPHDRSVCRHRAGADRSPGGFHRETPRQRCLPERDRSKA